MAKTFHSMFLMLMALLASVPATAIAATAGTAPSWEVDPADFRYDMTLFLDVSFATSGKMDYTRYEVGAFAADQCRGVATQAEMPDGTSYLYLRVRSNRENGEDIGFKIKDTATGAVSDIERVSIPFESDSRLGYPSAPYNILVVNYFNIDISSTSGGSVIFDNGRYAEGSEFTLTAIPDTGSRFDGWDDGNTDSTRTITVTSDITLKAIFSPETYRLVYTVDGETVATQALHYGETPEPMPEPSKEGHTFSGWSEIPETMPAHDVTITGSFLVNSYRLTVYLDGDMYLDRQLEFDTPVTIPEPQLPDDKSFNGWDEEVPSTMPAHDVVIHGTTSTSGIVETPCRTSDDIYTLDGTLVTRASDTEDTLRTLRRGIYIIGGRKTVVH